MKADKTITARELHDLLNETWRIIKAYYEAEPTDANAAEVKQRTDALFEKYTYPEAVGLLVWAIRTIESKWKPEERIGGYEYGRH